MSSAELKIIKKALKARKALVKASKEEATKTLMQAGILTAAGNLKGPFKQLQH